MSEGSSRGVGRISIDASLHDLFKELSEGNDPEKAPFRTMKDIFMLAACLGYQRGEKKPISGTKRQIFHWAQFSEQVDVPIIKAIAIASAGDVGILSDQENMINVVEEYANFGIDMLKHALAVYGQENLWSVINIVRGKAGT